MRGFLQDDMLFGSAINTPPKTFAARLKWRKEGVAVAMQYFGSYTEKIRVSEARSTNHSEA